MNCVGTLEVVLVYGNLKS